jgi:hypothetical protein
VDRRVWKKRWVVDCEPVGSGEQAFQYLAPYIFRVAISNNRLRKLEHGNVTFSYKESATDQVKSCTVTAEEFIRRFLQHVLPPRFIKVRYYGLLITKTRSAITKSLSASTKKPASVAGFLYLASASLASALLFFPRPDFPSASGPQPDYSNSK